MVETVGNCCEEMLTMSLRPYYLPRAFLLLLYFHIQQGIEPGTFRLLGTALPPVLKIRFESQQIQIECRGNVIHKKLIYCG